MAVPTPNVGPNGEIELEEIRTSHIGGIARYIIDIIVTPVYTGFCGTHALPILPL